MWEPWRFTTLWAFTACYRYSFKFLSFIFLLSKWKWHELLLHGRLNKVGIEDSCFAENSFFVDYSCGSFKFANSVHNIERQYRQTRTTVYNYRSENLKSSLLLCNTETKYQIIVSCTSFGKRCNFLKFNWQYIVRVSGYRSRGLGFDSRRYQIFWEVVGLERGPLSLVRKIEELL
jgi:hypothetical protein